MNLNSTRAFTSLMNDSLQIAGDPRKAACHVSEQGEVASGGARVAPQLGAHFVIRVKASDLPGRPVRGCQLQLETAGAMTAKDVYPEGGFLCIVATQSTRRGR